MRRLARTTWWTAAAALLALARPALAQQPGSPWVAQESGVTASMHGSYRLHGARLDELLLDADGRGLEVQDRLYQRLRLDPTLALGKRVRLISQLDLLNGEVWGDSSDLATEYVLFPRDEQAGLDSFQLRRLYLEWESPFGVWRVGQQTSHWGLGILANAGETDGPFSDALGGDLSQRVMWATTPLALFSDRGFARSFYLVLAADAVLLDDNADWLAGDRAYQAVGSLFYRDSALFAGAYAARRHQTDRDMTVRSAEPDGTSAVTVPVAETGLDVWALDLAFSYLLELEGASLRLAGEGALVLGTTTRGTNEASPDALEVMQLGTAFEMGFSLPDLHLDASLRTGYASGDRNTLDGTARAFKFDPGYRVGMILFDDVLDAVSANAADRLADPADKAVPPSGTRSIPTNAAVANAWFVAPAFSCSPLEWLGIDVGGMWAMAPVGLVDAYRTNVLAGGYPTNPWGAAAEGKNLGFEGSGGLRLRLPQLASLRTVLALQGGAFFPGDAFETEDGSTLGTIWKVRALIDVGW